jgi:hypothetical protein
MMSDFVYAEVVPDPGCGILTETTPVAEQPWSAFTTMGVIELLLKNPARLNELLRDEAHLRELIPSLLAVAMMGLTLHGVVLTAIVNLLNTTSQFWFIHMPAAYWDGPSVANLSIGYTVGAIAANGICLPSFYFYGLLAGIRISFLGVTAHALKGLAAGSVALVGLLPIYVAVALSAVVFPFDPVWARFIVIVGLLVPCLAGLVGALNLYEGFVGLADTMGPIRCASRQCFLRRLTLAWVSCATFVTPVVIYSLWHFLSSLT